MTAEISSTIPTGRLYPDESRGSNRVSFIVPVYSAFRLDYETQPLVLPIGFQRPLVLRYSTL